MNRLFRSITFILTISFCVHASVAQTAPEKPRTQFSKKPGQPATSAKSTPAPAYSAPDLTKQPTLYVVGYAHLDTEWRWEYPLVIREYLSKTLRNNFALFEKYPHYIFNFSGANRYRLMKEYFPTDYERLKQYVTTGRWFPAGSSMEESDVNSPSAESIFRQILYGNQYFRREFNKASNEYMLPDCFGFPASLPSILAHSGIKGFSTQKLTWGSYMGGGPDSPEHTPRGTPFNVGIWEGPDGKSVLAGLNPGSYSADITTDLSTQLPPLEQDPKANNAQRRELQHFQHDWARRVQHNGEVSGIYADYHYYGTGDIGGAPTEASVKLLEAIINKSEVSLPVANADSENSTTGPMMKKVRVGQGPVRVVSSSAEQMFLDIPGSGRAKLPRYKGELELTNHSAGSLTSESYQKRWNRKNELLADAAEKASVAAAWLGGRPYPQQRLNDAWTLVLGGQFHDIMAGTATAASYNYAWNDDIIAMNQFAGIVKSASSTVISAMDTRAQGVAIVVYNPLNIAREDAVEATINFGQSAPTSVSVTGPDGKEVPSQILGNSPDGTRILFLAKAPSVGYVSYDLRPGSASQSNELKVSESSLENVRYKVELDQNGDVRSIFDKSISKELLSGPARLAFQTEKPHDWPAWNMDWADQQKPPRGYVQGPARVRVVERGPARVAVEVERESEGSRFVQTIRLSAGDAGNRIEFANDIDWRSKAAALKATFPLTASNDFATYNLDVGTIDRRTNDEDQFEVASHQWVDLTDKSGGFGGTILSDCKYGSDKPDDKTLRLTLIYTPGLGRGWVYDDQTSQDFGHHRIVYGFAGHASDWRAGMTDWQGYRLNQPLVAFVATKHEGALGKQFSLFKSDNYNVRALALKKAEQSDEIVVRLVETRGKPAQSVHFAFGAAVLSAREVNGQESPVGTASTANGELVASFTPFQLHTFAVKLAPAPAKVASPQSTPIALKYDISVATETGKPSQGCFDCSLEDPTADGQGHALPSEMLSSSVDFNGVQFTLGPKGKPNAITAHRQEIPLPAGNFNHVYLLAAATGGDQDGSFKVGDKATDLMIQEWTGYIGQWDTRGWTTNQVTVTHRPGSPAAKPGAPPVMRTITEFSGKLTPGFIKLADVAWFSSHRHAQDGANEPYSYSYLFAYTLDVPAGAKMLTLPANEKIRILAISAVKEPDRAEPAQPITDILITPKAEAGGQ